MFLSNQFLKVLNTLDILPMGFDLDFKLFQKLMELDVSSLRFTLAFDRVAFWEQALCIEEQDDFGGKAYL